MKRFMPAWVCIILVLGIYANAADLPTQNIPRDSYDVGVSVLYIQNPDGTYSAVNDDNPLPTTAQATVVTATKSFSAGDVTTNDLTVFEETTSGARMVGDIYIDLLKATSGFNAVASAGDTLTIKLWVKIDGTNYRQVDNAIYTAGFITNNVSVNFLLVGQDSKITAAVSVDRGAYDLPYTYMVKPQ